MAVVVLALTVGWAWASTEISSTAGFTLVPDKEAAQVVGGQGRTCTDLYWTNMWFDCIESGDSCGESYWFFETWGCEDAPSGICPEGYKVGWIWCYCQGEPPNCSPDGNWYPCYVWACL